MNDITAYHILIAIIFIAAFIAACYDRKRARDEDRFAERRGEIDGEKTRQS